jgi:hypothetical protein
MFKFTEKPVPVNLNSKSIIALTVPVGLSADWRKNLPLSEQGYMN